MSESSAEVIVGSGLVASAMRAVFVNPDVCVYAAGVSNSGCTDAKEFERERVRLEIALAAHAGARRFIYFGTCSVDDPDASKSLYVQHKRAMEYLAANHSRYVIFRLPQVAGNTPNPHTLLNYLFARIARSERFSIWAKSTRNVIDIDDVAQIARVLVVDQGVVNETINIAHSRSVSIFEIVSQFELITGKRAVFDEIQLGKAYSIDCSRMERAVAACGVDLTGDYLGKVLRKYYEPRYKHSLG